MTVTLTHRSGTMTQLVEDADLGHLVAELDEPADSEHPDVAVTHESGWSLAAFPSGRVVWENVEEGSSFWHQAALRRDEVLGLFRRLAGGDIDGVASSSWKSGYGD